jgi:hypothetical protein
MWAVSWENEEGKEGEPTEVPFKLDLNPLPEMEPVVGDAYKFTCSGWEFDLRDDTYEFSVMSVKAWLAWVTFLKSREKVNGTLDAPMRIPEEYLQ